MKIGVLGTGHIAEPMVRLLAEKGHEITVSRRNEAVSARLALDCGVAIAEPQGVLDASDVVLLCLRPHVANEILTGLLFRADHKLISVMAGIEARMLREICAPATQLVQTIPLPFLDQGGCPLPAFGNATLLASLFEPENPVMEQPSEAALNAHFAACTLLPGALEAMDVSAKWLGGVTGDPKQAERYVLQLLAGYFAAMAKTPDSSLAGERDALATEGTLSLQMVDTLRAAGTPAAFRQAFTAINERLT